MIRLLDFLACDDIREERDGKLTLVGVYSDGIIITAQDTTRRLTLPKLGLFIRVMIDPDGPVPEAFQFDAFSGDERFISGEGTLVEAPMKRTLAIHLVMATVPLSPPQPLRFELRFKLGDDSWPVQLEDVPVSWADPQAPS